MKTDFLRGLGITEQSVIDAIMAENGRDINAVRTNTEKLETQVASLTEQLGERDTQLKDLKNLTKDNEALTAKISELESANATATTEYENKIAVMQKTHAIESGVRDAKAKNVKAVMALLDHDKITLKDGQLDGFSEQIDALTKGEDTSFLFGEANPVPPAPSGAKPNNTPPGTPGTPTSGLNLTDVIAKAYKK